MKTYAALLAVVALALTSGVADAKSKHSRAYSNSAAPTTSGQGGALSTGFRGPSTTNPQAAAGRRSGTAPHMVPENGSAPNAVVPRR